MTSETITVEDPNAPGGGRLAVPAHISMSYVKSVRTWSGSEVKVSLLVLRPDRAEIDGVRIEPQDVFRVEYGDQTVDLKSRADAEELKRILASFGL